MIHDHAQSRGEYVGSLTGLRGFAALWVFLYHAWEFSVPRLMVVDLGIVKPDFTPLFSGGSTGVHFFFVLSAFLLSLPFAHWACGERAFPAAGSYLVRRFKRVFPAFWVQLLVLLVLAFSTGFYVFPSTPDLLAHLLMAFHLPPTWSSPMNNVWWTLPTEFLFYLLLLPLAFLLKTRSTRLLLIALLVGTWVYRWWIYQHFHDQGIQKMVVLMGNTLGSLDLFIIGIFCAYLYVSKRQHERIKVPATVFLLLGISGVLLSLYSIHWTYPAYWEGHWQLFVHNTLIGISVASILISILLGSKWALRLFGNPFMMHCGIISYSLYLWHLPVLTLLKRWSFMVEYPGYRLPLLLVFSIPLTWLISYSSYRWVERPFLQRRGQLKSNR